MEQGSSLQACMQVSHWEQSASPWQVPTLFGQCMVVQAWQVCHLVCMGGQGSNMAHSVAQLVQLHA